jgi:hypothetical protein
MRFEYKKNGRSGFLFYVLFIYFMVASMMHHKACWDCVNYLMYVLHPVSVIQEFLISFLKVELASTGHYVP